MTFPTNTTKASCMLFLTPDFHKERSGSSGADSIQAPPLVSRLAPQGSLVCSVGAIPMRVLLLLVEYHMQRFGYIGS
jgi:hypothetical protein